MAATQQHYKNADGVIVSAEQIVDPESEYNGFWRTVDAGGAIGHVPDALFHEHFTLVEVAPEQES